MSWCVLGRYFADDMAGENEWECRARNTVEETTVVAEEIEFQVCKSIQFILSMIS